MPLNVTKIRTLHNGITFPNTTPSKIAKRMRGKSPILIFFISLIINNDVNRTNIGNI